jgi:hypothetical protein
MISGPTRSRLTANGRVGPATRARHSVARAACPWQPPAPGPGPWHGASLRVRWPGPGTPAGLRVSSESRARPGPPRAGRGGPGPGFNESLPGGSVRVRLLVYHDASSSRVLNRARAPGLSEPLSGSPASPGPVPVGPGDRKAPAATIIRHGTLDGLRA